MVEAKSVAAIVTGVLLAALGGIGTLVVLVGALAGVLEWGTLAWLLPVGVVLGAGLLTYGAVGLVSDLAGLVAGEGGPGGWLEEVGAGSLWRLLD